MYWGFDQHVAVCPHSPNTTNLPYSAEILRLSPQIRGRVLFVCGSLWEHWVGPTSQTSRQAPLFYPPPKLLQSGCGFGVVIRSGSKPKIQPRIPMSSHNPNPITKRSHLKIHSWPKRKLQSAEDPGGLTRNRLPNMTSRLDGLKNQLSA